MDPAGCHTHRHASRDSYYKNMINLIHHISFITFFWAISHHIAYPAKQVRRPLIVVACFTWLLWVSSKNVSYLRKNHNVICQFLFTLHKDPFHRIRSNRHATSACQSVEPVSRKRTCKVGPGRFIPRCRRIKIRLVSASKLTYMAHNSLMFYSCIASTHKTWLGCHCWGT